VTENLEQHVSNSADFRHIIAEVHDVTVNGEKVAVNHNKTADTGFYLMSYESSRILIIRMHVSRSPPLSLTCRTNFHNALICLNWVMIYLCVIASSCHEWPISH
jgi:hypothetical protein